MIISLEYQPWSLTASFALLDGKGGDVSISSSSCERSSINVHACLISQVHNFIWYIMTRFSNLNPKLKSKFYKFDKLLAFRVEFHSCFRGFSELHFHDYLNHPCKAHTVLSIVTPWKSSLKLKMHLLRCPTCGETYPGLCRDLFIFYYSVVSYLHPPTTLLGTPVHPRPYADI